VPEKNLDFTEARDREWQWHQLGHMQVFISLHASTPPLKVFYKPDAFNNNNDKKIQLKVFAPYCIL